MSLSTNRIKTTRLAVTARCRLDERVSPDIHHRDARLKQLLAPILAKGWDYSNKMIKDHLLACTTKMFEIFKNDEVKNSIAICLSASNNKASSSHPRGCPTIHLSKSSSKTRLPRFGGGEYYRRLQHCQQPAARIYFHARAMPITG